jgi:DNA-binding NarL/FixJ family response regulator
MNVQRVVLVGDVLSGLDASTPLAGADDFEVVGRATDQLTALTIVRELLPDLVLLDVDRPSGDAVALTGRLTRELPYVTIVLLTTYERGGALLELLKAGAQGYIVRTGPRASVSPSGETLVEHVRALARGDVSLSPSLAMRLLEEFAGQAAPAPPGTTLTPREREVLALVARGEAGRAIAVRLQCSEPAVRNHLRNVLFKLHQRGRSEAIPAGLSNGRPASAPTGVEVTPGWRRFTLCPRRAG